MIVFESEDAARQVADRLETGENMPETVTLESVEVRERRRARLRRGTFVSEQPCDDGT
jgi:hypothetical protein